MPDLLALSDRTVDLAACVVRTGRQDVPLSRQEVALLRVLIEARGAPVERDAAAAAVWPDAAPSDNALHAVVTRLRRKLEADPARPALLRTVRGTGYALLPAGEPAASSPAAATQLATVDEGFVGREHALAELAAAVRASRLVTLTGTGGVGKTTTALYYGRAHDRRAPVRLVDLSACADLGDVVRQAAWDLGTDAQGRSPAQALRAVARRAADMGEVLLVLDNAEQVREAVVALVDALLTGAPRARMLVTSREPLAHAAEREVALGPLDEVSAVSLFLARVGDARLDDVRRIVRAVDGIPLAIEMAASRADWVDVATLAATIDDALAALGSARRDLPVRQGTMDAAVRWSWALLDDDLRRALAWCSVFEGGFTVADAEAVLPQSPRSTLDALHTLFGRSLLRGWTAPAGRRVDLFTPVRAFAAERLDESGERALAERRHASHFATEVGPRARLSGEDAANVRAAWERSREAAPDVALRLALRLLSNKNLHPQAMLRKVAHEALSLPIPRPARAEAALYATLSVLERYAGHAGEADRMSAQAVTLAERCGDEDTLAEALVSRALGRRAARDFASAAQDLRRAAALQGERSYAAKYLLGKTLMIARDVEGAQTALRAALVVCERRHQRGGALRCRMNLAHLRSHQDPEAAAADLRQIVDEARAVGEWHYSAFAGATLATVLVGLRQWEEAEHRLRSATDAFLRFDHGVPAYQTGGIHVSVLLRQGRYAEARTRLEELDVPPLGDRLAAAGAATLAVLGEADAAAAWLARVRPELEDPFTPRIAAALVGWARGVDPTAALDAVYADCPEIRVAHPAADCAYILALYEVARSLAP